MIAVAVLCAWWSYSRHHRPIRLVLTALAVPASALALLLVAFVFFQTPAGDLLWP